MRVTGAARIRRFDAPDRRHMTANAAPPASMAAAINEPDINESMTSVSVVWRLRSDEPDPRY
jgi:hypothetical protein